ncbi:glycosyltransferase family 2 protein [Draconibacterium sp.]|nr:glycosyltransferase family 2 protein [Draconibacterium sp.]
MNSLNSDYSGEKAASLKYPTVSVVIPAYNAASYIERCLDSVFGQSHQSEEVIVVDDGSEDDLIGALVPYKTRIRLIRQSNQGAAKARNTGVRHSKSEYIAFLDSDDLWHPDKQMIQLSAIAKEPDIALCFCEYTSVHEDAIRTFHFAPNPSAPRPRMIDNFLEVFRSPYFGTPGVIIKREVFDEHGGFDTTFERAEDIDLWLRVGWRQRILKIEANLFAQVVRANSLSDIRSHSDNIRAIEKFCASNPEFASQHRKEVRQSISRVFLWWGRELINSGNFSEGRRKLAKSFLLKPISLSPAYLYLKSLFRLQ